MLRRISLAFFMLILPIVLMLSMAVPIAAVTEESAILHALEAELDLRMSGTVEIIPGTGSYSMEELIVRSYLFPRGSFHQDIKDFRTSPRDYRMDDGALILSWSNPPAGVLDYDITARIKTDGSRSEVRSRIPFPQDSPSFSEDVAYYLQSADLIDSDAASVGAKAEELLEGIDDYYEAVFTLARWVNQNIDYNLSTLNEDAERSASWVLDTRRGVCAEMTSLFIAMLRSSGIPARYVSGVSFTDSDLFDFNWGAHAWSDVYFPGHGWVPFDVTYGQYGFIDPSHMKLRSTLDSGEPSSYFQWYGRNIDIRSSMLEFDVDIIDMEPRPKEDIGIEITTRSEDISFGSYNLIIATITNKRNYYLPVTMTMSRTNHLEMLDEPRQEILLLPGEERKMYWRVRVDPDLSERHIYTFPVRLSSPSGHTAEESFTARASGMEFSKDDIDRALTSRLERGEVPYSSNVAFVCSFDQQHYYPDEDITVRCRIDNQGDLDLDGLEVCMHELQDYCKTFDLLGRQYEDVEFFLGEKSVGAWPIGLSLENEDVYITDELNLVVSGYPKVSIEDLQVPAEVDHGSGFNLSFILKGEHEPSHVDLMLSMNDLSRAWNFERMTSDREFLISMASRDLLPGENTISISVRYEDERGEVYNLDEDVNVELVNVPFFDMLFMRIRNWLESLIS